jgi:GNAT superfamily N-acetyltransferase
LTAADASPADAERLGRIIARAFGDDPVNLWLFRSGTMEPTFTALARRLYLKRGFAHLAGDLGAAMWLLDGRAKALSPLGTLSVAWTLGRSSGIRAIARALALDAAFERAHPKPRHAYLFAIGVVPEAQGKGLGGALMRAGLARVDAAGLPAYLESSKASNVPLYRHFGFEDLPPLAVPRGCPPIWPMWRPARVSRAAAR